MRILVFNWRDITHPWAGGAELNNHEHARLWVQRGHRVTLFCSQYPGSKRFDCIDGIDIVRRGGRFTVYLWAVVYYLLHFRGQYDVIVDIENGIPFFTPLYSRIPKVCLVHHVHTEQFLTEFSPPLSWIGIFLESVMMPWIYRRVPFVTVSETSREEMAGIGIDRAKCSVVYCGVDHDKFRPGASKTQQPSLIYLGRLMRYKRLDKLVQLMVPVIEHCPDAVLHIAGAGPAGSRLEQVVGQQGLEGHVVLHGHVSEEDKVRLLQKAWVLVTASVKEGWGLVIIEANACGTPAIAFNVPGLCEAIVNAHTGLLVESDEGFVHAVLLALQDHELRRQMSQAAVRHAKSFNWQTGADQMLGILALACKAN